MATLIIPTRTDGTQRYSMRCPLDGVIFGLEFLWNDRQSAWSLLLSDAADNVLLRVKVVVGVPLLRRFTSRELPRGELLAVDTAGGDADPGLDELGARVLLTYTEAADLAAAA